MNIYIYSILLLSSHYHINYKKDTNSNLTIDQNQCMSAKIKLITIIKIKLKF